MRGILLFLSFLLLGSIGVKGQSLFGEEQIISTEVQFANDVYAIDLDRLMRNEDSLKLNSIVYTFVLNILINEFNG
ncbi:MAG: hypothetical protein ACPGVB_11035, partial [Chitinophagales bacterium]